FVRAMTEDLRWLGIRWSEGPDGGGPCAPYSQSERRAHYLEAWRRLREGGFLYPCVCSRKDLAQSASAPNDGDDEPVYPGTCRERKDEAGFTEPAGVNWRFRVPEGEAIEFADLNLGRQRYVAGRNFDFDYFHCELVRDAAGVRLAKRHDALSIRHLRESGTAPEQVLEMAGQPRAGPSSPSPSPSPSPSSFAFDP